uniref:Large ribosomal subunit protein uL13c n=1 Tax=Bostrychia simpliciuscula TaxID=324754 RepID=A0A1Z1M8B5_9FLOR|nr:ribosomal protein L13 [Bostrychia simpliciuscula]ARW62142.1 ribosomal protein L13 [Bostrychia simpliciuscula]
MFINNNKTYIKKVSYQKNWYVINAKNQNLGRISSKIAYILKGKNDVTYLPYQESNTNIIIINSKYISVTGKKQKEKTYKKHSGKPGSLKINTFNDVQKKMPNKIIQHAVKGMLPKNSLGRKLLKKLKVYSDNKHPHNSQKPIHLTTN